MPVPEILKDRKVQIGVAALAVVVLVVVVVAVKRRNKNRPLAQVRNINEARPQNSSLANSTPPIAAQNAAAPFEGAAANPLAAFAASKTGELPTQ